MGGLNLEIVVRWSQKVVSSKADCDRLQELCMASNSILEWYVVSERKQCANFVKDRDFHGESIVWSTAHR